MKMKVRFSMTTVGFVAIKTPLNQEGGRALPQIPLPDLNGVETYCRNLDVGELEIASVLKQLRENGQAHLSEVDFD